MATKKKREKRYILAAIVAVLMLLSFLTGVLVSKLLLQSGDSIPTSQIVVDVGSDPAPTEETVMPTLPPQTQPEAPTGQTDATEPVPTEQVKHPGAAVQDAKGRWNGHTTVEIFKAQYDETGQITVKSVYGDKVVAPGTANSYYFDIINTGDTPISYTVKTEAILSFTVDGQVLTVPIQARFCDHRGRYLLGTENSLTDMTGLDGLKDTGGISVGNYVRYVLDWRWPFEGNDELDTLIGDLSAQGDVINVTVRFNVTAVEDMDASGGSPQTGDDGQIGLWVALCVVAAVVLIILLFAHRREHEDEEE